MSTNSQSKINSKTKSRKQICWVIKAGSQMVCSGGESLIFHWMKQIRILKKKYKVNVIWVTSGAIATAADDRKIVKKNKKLPEKQALSAIGQPIVIHQYLNALKKLNSYGAQVLLTAGDMKDSERKNNLKNTFLKLQDWDTLAIVNENDAVATEEIKFGDNDSLSAKIAVMMGAEKLILLTDVDGLYDQDPRKNKSAQLIAYKAKISNSDVQRVDQGAGSRRGTGGMYSKLLAASLAGKKKIVTHLVRGDKRDVLLRIANGEFVGTQIGGNQIEAGKIRSKKMESKK